MSKVLVCLNADFSANAVAKVSFVSKPCTGISFESDTISVNSFESVEVEYTVTPEDTTDAVIWSSSDETVVSVSGGVLTIEGMGTATITATCGLYDAEAQVTVDIVCVADWQYASTGPESVSDTSCGTYTSNSGKKLLSAFGKSYMETSHEMASTNSDVFPYPYAIKIPQNVTKVKVTTTATSTTFENQPWSHVLWMKDVPCGATGSNANKIKAISCEKFNPRSLPISFTVPENADAFSVYVRLGTARTEESANSAAETLGLGIEFLLE